MKRAFLAIILMFISLALMSCGHDHNSSPTFVTQILSDPTVDGDIELSSSGVFTITQGNVQSVFAGQDPASPDEFRAFLDFPLSGLNGVPGNAVIVSATLDIFIDNVFLQLPTDTIPIRVDLVSFQPPTLIASDFSRTTLETTTIVPPISLADAGNHVFVDVTSLMVQAQNLGLPDFQVRILEDPRAAFPGLIEIDEGLSFIDLAPLLQVEYF
jgi:hypothetical protein